METKHCKRCQLTLDTAAFHKNRSAKDGLTFYCRACSKELATEQRERALADRKPTDTKHCKRCDSTKLVGEFHQDRSSRDGLYGYCKECNNAKARKWTGENPEAAKAQGKRRSASGAGRADKLRQKYGLTVADYEARLAAQGGVCAICGTTEPGRSDRHFHVDHDHTSGWVRGLLCLACNRAIGMLKDDPAVLRRAADYIEDQP